MGREFTGSERRRYKRVRVSFIVFCRVNAPVSVRMIVGDKEVNAIALNISEGGMAILANNAIPSAALITVKFILFNEYAIREEDRTRTMEIQAEVRYILQTREKTYRLGIRFIDISTDNRRFLSEFARFASNK